MEKAKNLGENILKAGRYNAFESEPLNHTRGEDPLYKAIGKDSEIERHSKTKLINAYKRGAKHGFNPNKERAAREGDPLAKMYVRGFTNTQLDKKINKLEEIGKQAFDMKSDSHERHLAYGVASKMINILEGAYNSGNQDSRILRKKMADGVQKMPSEYQEKISYWVDNFESHFSNK